MKSSTFSSMSPATVLGIASPSATAMEMQARRNPWISFVIGILPRTITSSSHCKYTLRNLLMAWVLTLPAAILLSGSLYWLFSHLF